MPSSRHPVVRITIIDPVVLDGQVLIDPAPEIPGAVIELDRVAGSPADLMVNGRLIARGEVVVVDEDYGLRVTEIVDLGQAGL